MGALALLCCWSNLGTSPQLLQRDITAAIGGIADMTRTTLNRRAPERTSAGVYSALQELAVPSLHCDLDSFRTQRRRDFSGVGACATGKVVETAQYRHVGKTGRSEQAEVILLDRGTDDALCPELRISFGALADRLRYDDVCDLHSASRA